MKHGNHHHYLVMFFAMIFAGLLSTMNVWADKLDDVRYSLNDAYMTLLMTGWMFVFMGIFNQEVAIGLFGLVLAIVNIWCIRNQFLIDDSQYMTGMRPHHSMAIHMSKRLLEKETKITQFVENIVQTQEREIQILKTMKISLGTPKASD